MRTVKEISDITGISMRTLRYYDEIGLLKPSRKSEAGYRLYDDKALEQLQQILFFREFDVPLKEIMTVMENPSEQKPYPANAAKDAHSQNTAYGAAGKQHRPQAERRQSNGL